MTFQAEAAEYLFRCYFHQDWDLLGETDEDVLKAFVATEATQLVHQLELDLQSLIAEADGGTIDLDAFLSRQGNCYYYQGSGFSAKSWVQSLAGYLNKLST